MVNADVRKCILDKIHLELNTHGVITRHKIIKMAIEIRNEPIGHNLVGQVDNIIKVLKQDGVIITVERGLYKKA